MNPLAWTLLGLAVTILLGVFKLVYDLSREVSSISKAVEVAELPSMKKSVDRLVYRQELEDERAFDEAHSPHTPETDVLIEQLRDGNLTESGLHTIICGLDEAMKTERSGTKWLTLGLLKDRAKAELRDKVLETLANAEDKEQEGQAKEGSSG